MVRPSNALDVGRGIAIVAVIYGHALSPWVFSESGNFSEAAFLQWKFGAAFLMPFFFFLSGAGWREEKSFAVTGRQSLTLVFIAVLASAAYDLARLTASSAGLAAQLGGENLSLGAFFAGLVRTILVGDYYSLSPLWFIVTLAIVRLLAAGLVRASLAVSTLCAFLAVAVSVWAVELDWRNVYQIKPLGIAFLFFLAGRLSRPLLQQLAASATQTGLVGVLGLTVLALTFHLNEGCRWAVFAQCGEEWLQGRFGVAFIHGQIGNIPLFTLSAFGGVAFASSLAILLARHGGFIGRKLDAWGGNSLNLLIVNAFFLHVGNVFVDRWAAPAFAADNVVFFAALFMLTLCANLIAVRLMERPLRWLHRCALSAARGAIAAAQAAPAALAWARPSDRVSQQND